MAALTAPHWLWPRTITERDVELGDGVFDAAFYRGACAVDVVAGDANDEEVADSLVKENFEGDAGVGTADDGGDRELAGGERLEVLGSAAGVSVLPSGEALVPVDQHFERPVRVDTLSGSGAVGEGSEGGALSESRGK